MFKIGNIKSFADKETKKVFQGKFAKKIPTNIVRRSYTKLFWLDKARNIEDLRKPPSNHLEKLSGDRTGQYSIAINSQWRICFIYKHHRFYKVEIVDYHH